MFMAEEKPRVEEILRRIDELLDILRVLSEDLTEVSRALRTATSSIVKAQPVTPIEEAGVTRRIQMIDDVQRVFPQDLVGMLYFEEKSDHILIKPRQYLGSENFAKVASIVRDQLGGEYISAGRESHFKVPKT